MLQTIAPASLSRVRSFSGLRRKETEKSESMSLDVKIDAERFIKKCCVINSQAYTPTGAFILALARWRIQHQVPDLDWYRDIVPALKRRGAKIDKNWVCGALLASEQP